MYTEKKTVPIGDLFATIKTDKKLRNQVAYAHGALDQHRVFKHYQTCSYPITYIVTAEQIAEAKRELEADKPRIIAANQGKLILCAMGMEYEGDDDAVKSYRVRGTFMNRAGIEIFIEFEGGHNHRTRDDIWIAFCINRTLQRQYNDAHDIQGLFYNYLGLEKQRPYGPYTLSNILRIVNEQLNCNFSGVYVDQYTLTPDECRSYSPKTLL